MKLKKIKHFVQLLILIIIIGILFPQNFVIPVENVTKKNWNNNTFWYFPWGKSIVHKGIDIFAKEGTNVFSSTLGIVVYVGYSKNGGNHIYILGPKWRLHYYAHLQSIDINRFNIVYCNKIIGKVGNTGNALTTPSHLHYSIQTLLPYFWRFDKAVLGWKKIFYLNPIDYLNEAIEHQ